MATARVLQLLRSTTTYTSFTQAKQTIEGLTGHKDGEILLARYISGTSGEPAVNTYETAIGVYFEGHNKWTVFKSSTEIEAAITALQTELDRTQAGAGLGENGSYTAPTEGNAGYEIISGGTAATNLNDAINKVADYVYDTITAMDYSLNVRGASDSATTLTTGDASKVVTAINQADGQIAAGTTAAKDLLLTNYTNDGTTNTGSIVTADTVEKAFNKLENATAAGVKISEKTGNQITRVEGDATAANNGLYSHVEIAKLTEQEVTALDGAANVREAYKLINPTDRTAIGDVIKIYKDSSLQSVYLGHTDDRLTNANAQGESADTTVTNGTGSEALCFIYHLENGNYKLVAVDLESFLQESEFKDGLQVVNNEVSVKKDANSEQVYTAASTQSDVLTVSSNGVKVANVQNAINYASTVVLNQTVTKADERGVGGQNTTPHISIATTTVNGITRYSLTETDIASEDDLDAEIARAQAAEGELASVLGATGDEGSRAWTPTTNYGGSTTSAQANMDAIDAKVKQIEDGFVESVARGSAQNDNALTVNNTDPQNPVIGFNLSAQAASTTADALFAGGSTSNILQVKNDGLYLDNVWDCGQY